MAEFGPEAVFDGAGAVLTGDRRERQQSTPVARHMAGDLFPGENAAQMTRHVGIRVETEDGVGVRELVGQLLAIPLGQASDGDDLLGAAVLLEIGSLEQGVDRVLLRLLDEATGVDDGHIGLGSVVDEGPALGLQPAGQFLGIDLVAGATQGHEGDRALGTAHGGHVVTLVASGASATHGTVLP